MSNVSPSKEDLLRSEIVSTAQKLFQQYGLHKTTMEDIARAMGKGKSTLYYYYKSKEEIFDAVLRNEMEEVFNASKAAVDLATTPSDKLKAYFSISFEFTKSRVILFKIVLEEMAVQDLSRCHQVTKEMNEKSIQVIQDILTDGIRSGEFEDDIQDEIYLLSYSIICAMRSLILDLAVDSQIPDWDKRLDVLVDFLIKALRK